VLDGDPSPPQKGDRAPNFRPILLWMDQDAIWYGGGPGPDDIVFDGDLAPPKRVLAPKFSTHVYCAQTAVCIRVSLVTEVGLSLGDNVLDGDSATLP